MLRPFCFFLVLYPAILLAQVNTTGGFTGDESVFYAQTKQVNQFFRRFNAEEDIQGKRLYQGDPGYRDIKVRKNYLNILFDLTTSYIPVDTKDAFILDVTSKKLPVYLDFHSNTWFAEVSAEFLYNQERVNLILYMKLEQDRLGYKWAISNVYFNQFARFFKHVGDTSGVPYFIHPMSHELDFMNMHKVFDDTEKFDYYIEKDFVPDQLSVFIAGLKTGNLKFIGINSLKFHFFQIPGWYFEVSYFNRNSMNSGWLISNLLRVNEQDKNHLIRNYTHEK